MNKSFKVEVQTDDTGKWYTNAVRYPTRESAEREGKSLSMRWTAVKHWQVVESEDEPNRNPDGSLIPEKYQPTSEDIAWAHSVVDLIRDRGVWAYPDAAIIYQINKGEKKLVAVAKHGSGDEGFTEYQQKMHERTRVVFGAIGWSVEP
jgi:hypothetical protein